MHQNKFDPVTIESGEDLTANQYHAVAVDGTIADTSITAFGLLQNRPGASGRGATLGYAGQMKARAGAAISVGAALMVTTSGWIITATSAGNVIGKGLSAANSGDTFPGLFNFIGPNA